MQSESYARLRSLYDQVIDLPIQSRAARLRALEPNEEIVAEVLALIKAAEAESFAHLSSPLKSVLGSLSAPKLGVGDALGVWRIEREIGQGGMGSVYLVERNDGHFKQTAALKFLKGMPSRERLDYFTRERQLLATLTHPNIARLLDGGATPSGTQSGSQIGQPYLVMEYIDGAHVDVFCQRNKLSVDAILQLFVTTCEAVAFAHRQLIVHCDLKPSNILVNRDGRPILLDFGIATLIDKVAEGTVLSEPRNPLAYTPGYASPEQREGHPLSTVSDVYSLGVLLRELLGSASTQDLELAAIVNKASAAAVAMRYASVDALMDDIQRYRNKLPLRAHPASQAYLAKKFIQRRWPLVLAASIFLVTVAGFTFKVASESERARSAEQAAVKARDQAAGERDHATQAEAAAKQTNAFLISVFDSGNPNANSADIPASTLLTAAEERIEKQMQSQPETQAELFAVIGKVRSNMGNSKLAQKNYQRAIALERGLNRPLVLAQLLVDYAKLDIDLFGGQQGQQYAREALALRAKHASPSSEAVAESLALLGYSLLFTQGDLKESGALIQRSLALRERIDPGNAAMADSLYYAALHAGKLFEYPRAIELYQRSLAIRERLLGVGHPLCLQTQDDMATAYRRSGQLAQAEAIYRSVLAKRKRLYGRDSEITLRSIALLALTLAAQEKHREAAALNEDGLAVAEKLNGPDSIVYSVFQNNLGLQRSALGLHASAVELIRASLTQSRKLYPPNTPPLASMERNLGVVLRKNGQPLAAYKQLQLAYEAARQVHGDSHLEVATVLIELAQAAVDLGRFDDANLHIQQFERIPAAAKSSSVAIAMQLKARMAAAQERDEEALGLFVLAQKSFGEAERAGELETWLFKIPKLEFMASRRFPRAERTALASSILEHVQRFVDPSAPVLAQLRRLQR
jgi:eukaryotic-like serine/threonine-protein kinase